MKNTILTSTTFVVALFVLTAQRLPAGNIALNSAGVGIPDPTGSNRGWGGGTNQYSINDGLREYSHWANGLAFTGGHETTSGGPPWVEPAGFRQATINFGQEFIIDRMMVFHHGDEHAPAAPNLDYLQNGAWHTIESDRLFGELRLPGSGSGSSVSDEYTFSPVLASAIRYSFDNSGENILETFNIHGWIYEIEVYEAVPEPSSVAIAMVTATALVAVFACHPMRSRVRSIGR